MIKLIGFGRAFGVADPSPFVMKVDAFLRMSGLPYEYIGDPNALRRAPKGKLPMIEDDGKIVADSYFIFEYLRDKYQLRIDEHLSSEQRGLAHLLTKSLDENFYWTLVYSRWIREDTWPIVKTAIFGGLPAPLKLFVPAMVRRGVRSTLKKHGIGRHNETEIMQIFEHTLQSLKQILGEKNYFFGDKASSFDAAAFGFLSSFILVNIDNPYNQLARSYQSLMDFCQRINNIYYQETKNASAVKA
jgi:glutathione S-transferase